MNFRASELLLSWLVFLFQNKIGKKYSFRLNEIGKILVFSYENFWFCFIEGW